MGGLYLATNGLRLRKLGRRLQVHDRKRLRLAVPLNFVDRVILIGPVGLTVPCLRLLQRHGIPLLLLGRDGALEGWNPAAASTNSRGRVLQHLQDFAPTKITGLLGCGSEGQVRTRLAEWRNGSAEPVADFALGVVSGLCCLHLHRVGLMPEALAGRLAEVVGPLVVPHLPDVDPNWLEPGPTATILTNQGFRSVAESLESQLRERTEIAGKRHVREHWLAHCSQLISKAIEERSHP